MPFRCLMCLFLHCHPLLNPARKTHFPCLLGGPKHPPSQPNYYCQVKMPPLLMCLQNQVFLTFARKWRAWLGPPKTQGAIRQTNRANFFCTPLPLWG